MRVLRLLLKACLLQSTLAEFSLQNALFGDPDQETVLSNDPTRSQSIISTVLDDSQDLYELLRESYIQEGCQETFGDFPSTISFSSDSKRSFEATSICKCGLLYDSAFSIVGLKQETQMKESGAQLDLQPVTSKLDAWIMARTPINEAICSDGTANGYGCNNIDLVAYLPLTDFQEATGSAMANDVWGWTSQDGSKREFIIWGVQEGHYFIEVTNSQPQTLGFLPGTGSTNSFWRDAKVVGNFVFMGSEASNHGLQIFDMRRLLTINPETDCVNDLYCQELSPDELYTGNSEFPARNSHNIVANEESNFVYMVGVTGACNGGMLMVDVSNPLQPTTAGCFSGDGYVHDAQCVIYKGPDAEFQNSEICFSFNADTVTIVDVTDKQNIQILSRTSYDNVAYTHQGWVSTGHTHVVFGDEVDELQLDKVDRTRTLVLNVESLRNPTNFQEYFASTLAVDHNQYIVKATAKGQDFDQYLYDETDLIYQANYDGGLRVLQVIDYDTADFVEVGHFDILPFSNTATFQGAWSVFPFFESGLVAVSGIAQGLFLLKPRLELIPPPAKCAIDRKGLRYKGRRRKNCNWVGKEVTDKPRYTRYRTRKRCRKIQNGEPLSSWCWNTCGRVGLGPCSHLDERLQK